VRVRRPAPRALVLGAVVSGVATLGYQVIGVRALGETAAAPLSVLWSVQSFLFAVLLFPFEAFVAGGPRRRVRTCLQETAVLALVVGAVLWAAADRLPGDRVLLASVGTATVLAYGAFAVARGLYAARGDTRRYALLTGGEAVVRFLLVVPVAVLAASPASIAALLPVGPPVILALLLLLRRKPVDARAGAPSAGSAEGAGQLAVATAANAGAQLLLAIGPLVVALLGAGPGQVTVAFVILTLARVPVFLALGGLVSSRLPVLVALAREGRHAELTRTARRTAAGGAVLAVLAAGPAAVLGPGAVALVMGEGVRPPAAFVGVVAAGVLLTSTALLVNQVLVVRGRTARLLGSWAVATVGSVAVILVGPGDALQRVALALVAGQALGLAGLVLPDRLRRSPGRRTPEREPEDSGRVS
jgi:O-antigen/teichoic acid export membrane protein